MNNEKIGTFIKELREEKNWTQEELGEKIFRGRSILKMCNSNL